MTSPKETLDDMHQNSPSDIDEADYETDYEVGQDNINPFGLDIHNGPVAV